MNGKTRRGKDGEEGDVSGGTKRVSKDERKEESEGRGGT